MTPQTTARDLKKTLMFHKPRAVVVSRADEHGRRTVYDLLPPWTLSDGWIPVGRLDRDTTGLLLMVRDGVWMDRLSRPSACIKTYDVWVRGHVTDDHLQTLLTGLPSSVGLLRAVSVQVTGFAGPRTRLQVQLDEGKNRHIRRMFGALTDPLHNTPLKVLDLRRVAFGPLSLDIPSGQWRWLSDSEIVSLSTTIQRQG